MAAKERESNSGTHLKIKEDVFAKHVREQTKSFVTIVSAVVQVTFFFFILFFYFILFYLFIFFNKQY